MTDEDRRLFWRQQGATGDEAAELAAYARSGFGGDVFDRAIECPLPDEPFVGAWEQYLADAGSIGVEAALRRPLVQLGFPVVAGMSAEPAYQAAVRRGVRSAAAGADRLVFAAPDALRLFIHPTAAGRVPIVVAGHRDDFVSLVRAITRRNEPEPIPAAMGACIVAGYNNWDRVAALGPAFPQLAADKSLYQDRFIVLSSGPYSGVPAAEVGLDDEEWRRVSLTIRLEHECAHYVTRQALGAMRNSILDELIADHAGIVAAIGRYRADWFLRFVGLDAPAACRPDGRIHTYRGQPPLSDGAFTILHAVVRRAARQLERFDEERPVPHDAVGAARTIVALAKTGLEELASEDGAQRLATAIVDASRVVRGRLEAACSR